MVSKRTSFILILITVVWVGMVLWIIFPFNAGRIGRSPLFPFAMMFFALLPLYPLYRLAKKWPRLSSGIFVLGACLLLTLAIVVLQYVFHVDSPWVQHLLDLSQILCVLSSLLFVWQGLRRHS
jgi:hypothetical protein